MADLDAIGDALATRFRDVTPPSGQPAIQLATADLPEDLGILPAILVWQPSEEYDPFSLGRSIVQDWPIRFYHSREWLPRVRRALMLWRKPLMEALDGQVHLGLPTYVASSAIVRSVMGDLRYGGIGTGSTSSPQDYAGIELTARVVVYESASYVA